MSAPILSTLDLFTQRDQLILKPILAFYSIPSHMQCFIDYVVLKKHALPLRLLDWFVTNYAKTHKCDYQIKLPNGRTKDFSPYNSYRTQLETAKKKDFDPYCRGTLFTLDSTLPDGRKIQFETATCQLKFFKWAIENSLLDYVELHYDEIYADMNQHSSQAKHKLRQLSSDETTPTHTPNVRPIEV
jgi:hypothetical protein